MDFLIDRIDGADLEARDVIEQCDRGAATTLVDDRGVAIDAEDLDRMPPHVLAAPREEQGQIRATAARIEQANASVASFVTKCEAYFP